LDGRPQQGRRKGEKSRRRTSKLVPACQPIDSPAVGFTDTKELERREERGKAEGRRRKKMGISSP